MKGIILAAGKGTRLYPMTKAVNKQLIPIYDKPMIYYPLSILMESGIKDIMFIVDKDDLASFKKLFGDGQKLGLNISYEIQEIKNGTVGAFSLAKDFVEDDASALIFGDNVFYGDFENKVKQALENANQGYATVFGYEVEDPRRFGVIELDENESVISIEEKPEHPKSNNASTGLYFYPKGVMEKVSKVKITGDEYLMPDLLTMYLNENKLKSVILDQSYKWFDTGTFESLFEASSFIKDNQEEKVFACLEEISYRKGWITKEELKSLASTMNKNSYGKYLEKI